MRRELSPQATCGLILVPMVGTFLVERLFHRFGDPNAAVFVAGYHVHHLFFGVLTALPASFVLAFGFGGRRLRGTALAALGLGSGLILDEFIAMIATDMSTPAYLGRVSLGGAAVLVALFSAFLLVLMAVAKLTTPSDNAHPRRLD
jgi:hypothetical protein